ncbi:hypothetical protein G7Y89_g1890 [Cudoniella acicularis]|uniref:Uncharacterized protein n=1 Tax=Cudoniella acicularis TaxID=354080 RepID=A0A8H4RUF6_9HELO|nr:hypothetical protein G7Y89_g1890 [Cudoniella acicularis]
MASLARLVPVRSAVLRPGRTSTTTRPTNLEGVGCVSEGARYSLRVAAPTAPAAPAARRPSRPSRPSRRLRQVAPVRRIVDRVAPGRV